MADENDAKGDEAPEEKQEAGETEEEDAKGDEQGESAEGEKYLTGKNFDTAVDKSNQNNNNSSKASAKNNK